MRVALLTFEYPDARAGGIGSYVLRAARALAAGGHEPHIFTLTLPAAVRAAVPRGVIVHEVADFAERVANGSMPASQAAALSGGVPAIYKLAVGRLLAEAVLAEHACMPFDIAEAAEYEALGLPLLARRSEGMPVVTQIHLSSAVNASANESPVDPVAEALELTAIVGADGVCAATQNVVDITRRLMPFERQAEVIPYPIDPAVDPADAPTSGPILFVGRLQKRKGCDVLAVAASILLRKFPDAELRIAGADTPTADGGSMQQQMLRLLGDMRNRVLFLGEISQAQVREEVKRCRFQVVPSRVENFAGTATDAMAAGRAVIYGGQTGLDEVVGDAGIRVWPLTAENLARQMEFLYANPAAARDLGRRGAERIREHFSFERVMQQRVAFYLVVIEAARNDRRSLRDRLAGLHPDQRSTVLAAIAHIEGGPAVPPTSEKTPGKRVTDIIQDMRVQLRRAPLVWIFGAGRHTSRLMAERFLWESRGFKIAGIIDDHPRFAAEPELYGLKIRSRPAMEAAIDAGEKVDAILLSTDTLGEMFWERTEGFRKRRIETLLLY